MPRSIARTFLAVVVLFLPLVLHSQTEPTGGAQTQAQQQPCLPEDEPCGGGGTGSVTVSPDDGEMTVTPSSTNNVADFLVTNNYGSSATYSLTCGTMFVGTCTSIKNPAGLTITSINLPAGGRVEITVHFTAAASPASGFVKLTASNGIWSDVGSYGVAVTEPPPPPAPAAPTAQLHNHNRSGIDRGLCFTAGAGQAAGSSCGDLFVTHGMPAYRTMGKDRSLSLLYNSAAARGQVLVAARVTQPANSTTPTKLTAVLRVGGLRDSADFAPLTPGAQVQVVMGDRLPNTIPTGVYVDTLVLRNTYATSVIETVVIDTVVVVNNRQSEYGQGWSLIGVERLVLDQPAGSQDLLWIGGDGSALRYRRIAANTWVAPAADFRDTISALFPGTDSTRYVRNLRHKVKVVYDVQGRHIQTINRYDQATTFVYDTYTWIVNTSMFSVVRLARIRVPGNDAAVREYRLYWSYTYLDSIADPGGRKLRLARVGNTVTAITDPDGQQTRFEYDGPDELLSARKVPNPAVSGGWARTSYAYAGRSKLTRTRIQAGPTGTDSTVIKYLPWQVNGLDTLATGLTAPGFPTSPVAGFASTVDGPIAGTGDRYSAWVDPFGAPTRTHLEGTGAVTELYRDSTAMPALVTRVKMPGSRMFYLRYNSRGNLVMQRDSTWGPDSLPVNVNTWAYGNVSFPDTPTALADLFGRTTTSVLHPTFGVPTSVTDPRGHTTAFSFLTSGLVQSVSELNVETWVQGTRSEVIRHQTTTFQYDGMGQVRKTVTPHGAFTVWQSDTFGRVTAAWDPFNTRTQYVYDPMNRIRTQTIDSGAVANPLGATNSCTAAEFICAAAPAVWPAGTAPSFVTSTYYGSVGLDSVVAPRAVPRSFRYDAGGVQVRESDHDTTTGIHTFVNAAGLIESTVSRDSQVVRFRYDAIGRLVAKIWPARTWSALYDDGRPTRWGATIPGDSVVYQYDPEGRLLSARATGFLADSIVRTYWGNGAIRTVVSTKLFLDSLSFWYDSSGALERKAHVTVAWGQVARDTTIYRMNRSTGTLDSMVFVVVQPTAAAGRRLVGFTWDALGRRRSVTYPSGHVVALRYDVAGVMRRLTSGPVDGNGLPSCGYPYANLCVSVANDSVDLRGNILHTDMWCGGMVHPGYACGTVAHRELQNSYYRTGWLARQLDGSHTDSTIVYNESGSIVRRWDQGRRRWHRFTYETRTNRVARDSIGAAWVIKYVVCGSGYCRDSVYVQQPTVAHYSRSGDRLLDTVSSVVAGMSGPSWDDRYYYYDALGRTTGVLHFDGQVQSCDGSGCWWLSHGEINGCFYDVEGRMVRACGAQIDVAYDNGNVSATNYGIWHFMHGPGTDDPLIGIGQPKEGAVGATKEFYWVTDGQGRQLAIAEPNGYWDPALDLQKWPGFLQAGGVLNGMGYHADRSQGSSVSGLSYFRNRLYDQRTGQWTQEDPIGLAGGINLYQYAGGNPVMFSDPFGLCASGGDSTKVSVVVDCGDGTTSRKDVWVQEISESEAAAVVRSAGRLTGGTSEITPELVQRGYQTLADAHALYVLPETVDGHRVIGGGLTRTGGGQPVVTAFRPDALRAIVSGDLGAKIGNRGFNAANVLGHEGAHYWGSEHPGTYAIRWGFTR